MPPALAPAGLTFTGGIYDLNLTGTDLSRPATLRLPAPAVTVDRHPRPERFLLSSRATRRWNIPGMLGYP